MSTRDSTHPELLPCVDNHPLAGTEEGADPVILPPSTPTARSMVEVELKLLRQAFQEQGKAMAAMSVLLTRIVDTQSESEVRLLTAIEKLSVDVAEVRSLTEK